MNGRGLLKVGLPGGRQPWQTSNDRSSSKAPGAEGNAPCGDDGDDRGAAVVEFALVLPVLVLFVFGIIEFGRAYNARIELTSAVREGARALALGGDPAAATTATRTAAPGLTPAKILVTTDDLPGHPLGHRQRLGGGHLRLHATRSRSSAAAPGPSPPRGSCDAAADGSRRARRAGRHPRPGRPPHRHPGGHGGHGDRRRFPPRRAPPAPERGRRRRPGRGPELRPRRLQRHPGREPGRPQLPGRRQQGRLGHPQPRDQAGPCHRQHPGRGRERPALLLRPGGHGPEGQDPAGHRQRVVDRCGSVHGHRRPHRRLRVRGGAARGRGLRRDPVRQAHRDLPGQVPGRQLRLARRGLPGHLHRRRGGPRRPGKVGPEDLSGLAHQHRRDLPRVRHRDREGQQGRLQHRRIPGPAPHRVALPRRPQSRVPPCNSPTSCVAGTVVRYTTTGSAGVTLVS